LLKFIMQLISIIVSVVAIEVIETPLSKLNFAPRQDVSDCTYGFGGFLFGAICLASEDAYESEEFNQMGLGPPGTQLYTANLEPLLNGEEDPAAVYVDPEEISRWNIQELDFQQSTLMPNYGTQAQYAYQSLLLKAPGFVSIYNFDISAMAARYDYYGR
jgi:hypothetical protein